MLIRLPFSAGLSAPLFLHDAKQLSFLYFQFSIPNFDKVREHIGFGLCVRASVILCVHPFVRDVFLNGFFTEK